MSSPDLWEEFADEWGNVYYVNHTTGETSWTLPGAADPYDAAAEQQLAYYGEGGGDEYALAAADDGAAGDGGADDGAADADADADGGGDALEDTGSVGDGSAAGDPPPTDDEAAFLLAEEEERTALRALMSRRLVKYGHFATSIKLLDGYIVVINRPDHYMTRHLYSL